MTKKNKTVIAVLSVILVICALLAAVTSGGGFTRKISGAAADKTVKLSELETVDFKSDYPLVQTQDKSVFYEAYPDGSFKFFRFDGSGFSEITDGISVKDVNLKVSYQPLKVKLYYLKTEVGTVGYGLFNSEQGSETKLLSYVFVRMMDCPKAYKKEVKTDYILLTDREPGDSYKPDKTYSDMFSFNLKDGKTSQIFGQRDRTAQKDGTTDENWTIFTDTSMNTQIKKDLFASGRVNDTASDNPMYCLMSIADSKAKKKAEASTVNNCISYEVREKDGNYFCLVSTETGFDLVRNGDKKNPVKSFEGEFSGYSVSGDWILNKSTAEFTNFFTGETKSTGNGSISNFAGFTHDESGSKFAVFINGEKQSLIMYNTQDGTSESVTDRLFDAGIRNFCFIDGEHILFSSYDDSGAAVNTILNF